MGLVHLGERDKVSSFKKSLDLWSLQFSLVFVFIIIKPRRWTRAMELFSAVYVWSLRDCCRIFSPSVPFSCEGDGFLVSIFLSQFWPFVLISCFPKGREGKFEGLRGVKMIVHARSLRYWWALFKSWKTEEALAAFRPVIVGSFLSGWYFRASCQ